MDKFFSETDPNETVKRFEKMGYTFTECPIIHWGPIETISLDQLFISSHLEHKKHWYQKFLKKETNSAKKLTSEYLGSFFCLKLQYES